MELTHFNDEGRARMVDVTQKSPTVRTATAAATVYLNQETFHKVQCGQMEKGDVLAVAQVAGIMAAKRCWELIPMCHPIMLTGVDISFTLGDERYTIGIEATARCKGETGVEMEALMAVSTAALTIYDMCKAVQRDITIGQILLLGKSGGRSGDFTAERKGEQTNG